MRAVCVLMLAAAIACATADRNTLGHDVPTADPALAMQGPTPSPTPVEAECSLDDFERLAELRERADEISADLEDDWQDIVDLETQCPNWQWCEYHGRWREQWMEAYNDLFEEYSDIMSEIHELEDACPWG